MFDLNGPLSEEVCKQILIEVADKRKSEKTKHLARIKHIAEAIGYDQSEVRNNAEYLVLKKYLEKRVGGFLGVTRSGADCLNRGSFRIP